tara:strand:- start:330 stop:497 length:168 start_codon:yes stop_codon:yes gene_type:complete
MRNFLNDFNRKLPTSMKMGNFKALSTAKPKEKSRSPPKVLRSDIISKEIGDFRID